MGSTGSMLMMGAAAAAIVAAVVVGLPLMTGGGPEGQTGGSGADAPVPEASAAATDILITPEAETQEPPVETAAAPGVEETPDVDLQAPPALVEATQTPPPVIDSEPADVPEVLVAVPQFDVLRVSPEGAAVVAGRADPGVEVALMLDRAELLRVETASSGEFVALFDILPADQPRQLTLLADPDGDKIASDETRLIAPFGAPEAAPDAEAGDVIASAAIPQTEAPDDAPATAPVAEAEAETTDETVEPEAAEAELPEPAQVEEVETAEPPLALAELAPVDEPSQAPVVATETAPVVEPSEEVLTRDETPASETETGPLVTAEPDVETPDPEVEVVAELPPEPEVEPVTEDVAANPDASDAQDVVDSGPQTEPQTDLPSVTDDTEIAAADVEPADVEPADVEPAAPEVITQTEPAPLPEPEVVAEDEAANDPTADAVAEVETAPAPEGPAPVIDPSTQELAEAPTTSEAPAAPTGTAEPELVAQAPAILSVDADGIRLVQPGGPPAAPDVLANVSLDTITYDPAGEVVLAGRAAGEGFVQVYLDNRPITTARIPQDGVWRTDLPDVDTGVYTLRIDEVDDSGEVVSRVETPFRREEPETVAEVLADETSDPDFSVASRTVQPGNTLWAISRERYGEGILYVEVFEANRDLIRNPDLIYPGQVFRLPEIEGTASPSAETE